MITSLKLRNFKCFPIADIPMGALTLLAGLNGSGKSSVIQALLLLRQSMLMGELARGQLILNGDITELGTAQDILAEDASEDILTIELSYEGGTTFGLDFPYDRAADRLIARDPERLAALDAMAAPFGPSLHYLSAHRLGPQTSLPLSEWRVRHRQLGIRGEYVWHYLMQHGSEVVEAGGRIHPNAEKRTLLAQTEAWLADLSPGVHIHLEPINAADRAIGGYSFDRPGKDVATRPYRPTNVGFGLSYTLPLIVALLSTAAGGLVILENPEAHLHPGGQTKLGRLDAAAAANGVQVILETHSDHVLNGIRLAVRDNLLKPSDTRLLNFERIGNVATIQVPRIDEQGRIDFWPRGFFDESEIALAQLIAPRRQ